MGPYTVSHCTFSFLITVKILTADYLYSLSSPRTVLQPSKPGLSILWPGANPACFCTALELRTALHFYMVKKSLKKNIL